LAPINEDDIRKAIEHELARNGQIYYIVPRINMIRDAVDRLNRMFPDLQIMTAHGQMGWRHSR
jgi:transcription-repair coupling factor (superfamily II helicase)